MVAWKANELRIKASMIGYNVHKYNEYFSEISAFNKNIAIRGVAFE